MSTRHLFFKIVSNFLSVQIVMISEFFIASKIKYFLLLLQPLVCRILVFIIAWARLTQKCLVRYRNPLYGLNWKYAKNR